MLYICVCIGALWECKLTLTAGWISEHGGCQIQQSLTVHGCFKKRIQDEKIENWSVALSP